MNFNSFKNFNSIITIIGSRHNLYTMPTVNKRFRQEIGPNSPTTFGRFKMLMQDEYVHTAKKVFKA